MSCDGDKGDNPGTNPGTNEPAYAPDGGSWVTYADLVTYKKRLLYELLQRERANIFFVDDFGITLSSSSYSADWTVNQWEVDEKVEALQNYTPSKSWPLSNSRVWFKSPEAYNRFYHLFDEGQPDAYGIAGINRVERNMRYGKQEIYKGDLTENGELKVTVSNYIGYNLMESIMQIPITFDVEIIRQTNNSKYLGPNVGVSVLFCEGVAKSAFFQGVYSEGVSDIEGTGGCKLISKTIENKEYSYLFNRSRYGDGPYVGGNRCVVGVIPYWELLSDWSTGIAGDGLYSKQRYKRVQYKVACDRSELGGYNIQWKQSGVNAIWGPVIDSYTVSGDSPGLFENEVPFYGDRFINEDGCFYTAQYNWGGAGDYPFNIYVGNAGNFSNEESSSAFIDVWVDVSTYGYLSNNGNWVEVDFSQVLLVGVVSGNINIDDIEGLHYPEVGAGVNVFLKGIGYLNTKAHLLRYLKKL